MRKNAFVLLLLLALALPLQASEIWSRLDLTRPGLEKVGQCCGAGEYAGAASALLE